ncbi:Carboxysome shell and ethanolamine utilization microcompartment protein CcmL/EutN [Desulfacinum infernum DSM 9756]|uniref:Carboxysome shell and ethanolamine utilization microcompartment protein CcmL/EutN n=1 Tax=Desulfacinum infernum DSM 9756 TaxID=1121391 RepID=A0A1M5IAW8_9BACT|nr:BMC domain-containing protein [Desulfacinum infernum]SHG25401.1 Carboxysome shell and ethanolamine utilization microcompartment protein CcmL/EutN [Desulfacinum infernum DSM 9756]
MTIELQAVGMVEFNSIAAGIDASDHMVKAASVQVLFMKTICPGKFVAAVHGEVAAVQASVDAGLQAGADTVVDHFLIPRIHPAVVAALSCAVDLQDSRGALGVLETFSAASAVAAADQAVKAADVHLLEVRMAMGLGGKAFVLLHGDVAAVEASVEAGAAEAARSGLLVRRTVIPSLDPQVFQHIL